MYAKRIIPCLDVKNGRVVKGVSFVDLRDAGDPVECAAAYDKQGADELVLLVCRHFQIGKTYLYKIVGQSYGTGIAEHIRTLRIEKAKSLLIDQPGLSIDTIAEMCGFQDYNYFITVFRKKTGVPPRQYRLEQKPQ